MNIRHIRPPAAEADIRGVMTVMTSAFPPRYGEGWTQAQLRATFRMPGVDLFLAEDTEGAAGFALIRHVVDEAELLLIAVAPDRQRQSVGRRLMQAVEDYLCERGMAKLFLEMRAGNSAEILYRKFGLEKIGERAQYYRGANGQVHDAVTFGKRLRPGR